LPLLPTAQAVSVARERHEEASSGQCEARIPFRWALLPYSGETGVAESIAVPACTSCATTGWKSRSALPARADQTPRLRSFPVRSGRIIASAGTNGWHVIAGRQRPTNSPSSCSGCQRPSLPFSACPPGSSVLLPGGWTLLLGETFLSEWMLMLAGLELSSASPFCRSFCSPPPLALPACPGVFSLRTACASQLYN